MSVQFPAKLDPWRAARSRQRLEGVLAARDFTRIPAPGRVSGPVQVRLELTGVGAHQVKIELWLRAPLSWLCQRCLEPMRWRQQVARTLMVVEPVANPMAEPDAVGPATAADTETITVARGERLSLRELIEDELLLALPFAPMHEHCEPIVEASGVQTMNQDNPFTVLAQLRNRDIDQ